jgi:hypothetical protein
MKNIDRKSLSLGLLIGALATFGVAAASNTGHVQFEYDVVSGLVLGDELERNMNKASASGWELVETGGFGQQGGFAVFRREKR